MWDGSLNGYFFRLDHFSYDMKHTNIQDRSQNQTEAITTFSIIFGARMYILLIYQSEDSCAYEMVVYVISFMFTIKHIIVSIF